MAEENIFSISCLDGNSPASVGINGIWSRLGAGKSCVSLLVCRMMAWYGHRRLGLPDLQMHGWPLLTHWPVGSFFCTGNVKYANLVKLVS